MSRSRPALRGALVARALAILCACLCARLPVLPGRASAPPLARAAFRRRSICRGALHVAQPLSASSRAALFIPAGVYLRSALRREPLSEMLRRGAAAVRGARGFPSGGKRQNVGLEHI
eukprot:9569753-Alexandrium_andersonii.AAC.1